MTLSFMKNREIKVASNSELSQINSIGRLMDFMFFKGSVKKKAFFSSSKALSSFPIVYLLRSQAKAFTEIKT